MASLKFYANTSDPNDAERLIDHVGGEGLGFYGLGEGLSVPVGSTQNTTFLTNALGTVTGERCHNTSMSGAADDGLVQIENADIISLANLPNSQCPLNIRFEHDEAVRVQNCKLRIFDRSNPDVPAVGVTTYVYEARHPSSSQSVSNLHWRARDANTWVTFEEGLVDENGDAILQEMNFTSSPGQYGQNSDTLETDSALGWTSTEAESHASLQHDWYVAISAEPNSIGSKTEYGLFFTLEYLA